MDVADVVFTLRLFVSEALALWGRPRPPVKKIAQSRNATHTHKTRCNHINQFASHFYLLAGWKISSTIKIPRANTLLLISLASFLRNDYYQVLNMIIFFFSSSSSFVITSTILSSCNDNNRSWARPSPISLGQWSIIMTIVVLVVACYELRLSGYFLRHDNVHVCAVVVVVSVVTVVFLLFFFLYTGSFLFTFFYGNLLFWPKYYTFIVL